MIPLRRRRQSRSQRAGPGGQKRAGYTCTDGVCLRLRTRYNYLARNGPYQGLIIRLPTWHVALGRSEMVLARDMETVHCYGQATKTIFFPRTVRIAAKSELSGPCKLESAVLNAVWRGRERVLREQQGQETFRPGQREGAGKQRLLHQRTERDTLRE